MKLCDIIIQNKTAIMGLSPPHPLSLSIIPDGTWDVTKDFDRLVHGLEGFVDVLLNVFRIEHVERIVQPALLPPQPVRYRNPQVTVWFKVFCQLANFIVLNK